MAACTAAATGCAAVRADSRNAFNNVSESGRRFRSRANAFRPTIATVSGPAFANVYALPATQADPDQCAANRSAVMTYWPTVHAVAGLAVMPVRAANVAGTVAPCGV